MDPPELVVGIGASAGGLESIERVLGPMDEDTNLAFVVAQHLSPDHKSMMSELLQRRTKLVVSDAVANEPILAGRVYLAPSHANLVIRPGYVSLEDRAAPPTLNLSIDVMFRSLADSYGDRAVAVVLSGTGSDGRDGARAVKSAGGTVFAQEPSTARFDGMPKEVIRAGVVDGILAPENLSQELQRISLDRRIREKISVGGDLEGSLEELSGELRKNRTLDLAGYKQTTILRRIDRRMSELGIRDLRSYVLYVRSNPAETMALVRELLINVTRFFRDPAVFDALEGRVLPELRGRVQEALRIWVPGCSTGQEVYSLAMILSEAGCDFKIFGTDVDDDALARAAIGFYTDDDARDIPPDRKSRHFRRRDGGFEVNRDLRTHVAFAHHDLLSDPPFTRMNVVSCRNVLIYLKPEAQHRVVESFSFALRDAGVLVLGTSEVLGQHFTDFRTVDARLKIYARQDGRRAFTGSQPPRKAAPGIRSPSLDENASEAALRLLVDRVTPAAVLVTDHARIVRVFGNAGSLLTFPVGEPTIDILSVLPGLLRSETAAAIREASTSMETVTLATHRHDKVSAVRGHPFKIGQPATCYVLLIFEPGDQTQTSPPLTFQNTEELASLQRELDITRQHLRTAIEVAETTSEELQSTNEELLASNEELHATNEELQSVNEELHTVNGERKLKIAELSESNADLDNLLDATPVATIFLDDQLRIRRFNPPVEELFPLAESDRGRPLAHFASRLSYPGLIEDLEQVISQGITLDREVSTVAGSRYLLRAIPHVGAGQRIHGVVMTFSNSARLRATEARGELLQSVLDAIPSEVLILDDKGTILFANTASLDLNERCGLECGLRVGANYLEACRADANIHSSLDALLQGRSTKFSQESDRMIPSQALRFRIQGERTRDGSTVIVTYVGIPRHT